jgi:predicted house-cleaning NTP pyrophosphatase (Maf/HAM1 superfamily)
MLAFSGRDNLQGRTHQLVTRCQMVSAVNMHTNNSVQTEQVIFRNMHEYTYAYVHVTTVLERGCEFERAKRGTWDGLE